ncbi:MAG: hotdog fold thioesterase [Deltaproteobacteria bacterium]|nr:hotdog fold thioesterase [Deltaproteobacteria bacterium]
MDQNLRSAIFSAVEKEPFAKTMGLRLVELSEGCSTVAMLLKPESMDNLFSRAHGGAVFALIDEAFETACQTHGTVAVALNVSTTYVKSPEPGANLTATAKETSLTKRTASYEIRVTEDGGGLIAICQALAFRTGKPLPFFEKAE